MKSSPLGASVQPLGSAEGDLGMFVFTAGAWITSASVIELSGPKHVFIIAVFLHPSVLRERWQLRDRSRVSVGDDVEPIVFVF